MGFFDRFRRKESQARIAMAVTEIGRPAGIPKNLEAYTREGYQANVIGFKCVSIVSKACAGIPWCLQRKGGNKEIDSHPLLDLLKQPNPMQGQSAFFEAVVAYFMITGNSYVEANAMSDRVPPGELWSVRADRVKVIPGRLGVPESYEFTGNGGAVVRYPVDILGRSNMMQMKTFHPTNQWYGMSPIEAAVNPIDQHNESGAWNTSMLRNSAVPSGALIIKQDAINPLGALPNPQQPNIREQLQQKYAGSNNAGRMMLLEGAFEWKQMGFSPKDMDWMEGRKMSARDIALAFGVPPIMLNIPGDSTFANYKEARVALYEDTIIPLMDFIRDELNKWLTPRFGSDVELEYDRDQIEPLQEKRLEMYKTVDGITFITDNEKRKTFGFDPIEGADRLLKNSGLVPIEDIGADATDPNPAPVDAGGGQDPNAKPNPADGGDGGDSNQGDQTGDTTQDAANQNADDANNKHWKQINAISPKDKAKVWRKINAKRGELQTLMYHDVRDSMDAMAKDLGSKLRSVDPKVAEFAALKIIGEHSDKLKAEMAKNLRRGLKMFAENILSSGKDVMGFSAQANKSSSPQDFEEKTLVRFNQFVDAFVEKHTATAIKHIEGTSIKKARAEIRRIVQEGIGTDEGVTSDVMAKQMQSKFEELSDGRATLIARTESAIASNQGALGAAKSLDIPDLKKEWVAVNDDRTRDDPNTADHSSMDGVKVGMDDKFTVPPDSDMDAPGDPSAPPEQVINCRCVLTFSR